MSQSEVVRAGAYMHALAEKYFAAYPNTISSLGWLDHHVGEMTRRLVDFESVNARINSLLVTGSFDVPYQAEIDALRSHLGGKHIPTIPEADTHFRNNHSYHSPEILAFLLSRNEFGWADSDYDPALPAKSAMGILLEGYGKYIGLLVTQDRDEVNIIQHAYVEAAESVLLIEYPDSEILKEVIDWMKSDAHKFSKPIQEALNKV